MTRSNSNLVTRNVFIKSQAAKMNVGINVYVRKVANSLYREAIANLLPL